MGVELISVGSTAPWYTKVSSPVTRGLEGWFCFDTDISRIGFNRAPGKPDASIVGQPVVKTGHVEFKSLSNYLNTSIPESADMTVLLVGKSISIPNASPATSFETTPMFFGTYVGPSALPGYSQSNGMSLYSNRPGVLYAGAARDDGTGANQQAVIAASMAEEPNSWALHAMRIGNSIPTDLFNLTTNQKSTRVNANIRVPSTNNLRIGGAYYQFAGEVAISQVVVFSVALTNDEINKIAALMRTRAARLGITV